jgi:hypothetical protein
MPRQPPSVQGPVHQVPCPHCGRPNDMREIDAQNLLDTGSEFQCTPVDGQPNTGHCGRVFVVTRIANVKLVAVAPVHRQVRQGLPPAQPARTVAAGVLARLLGK